MGIFSDDENILQRPIEDLQKFGIGVRTVRELRGLGFDEISDLCKRFAIDRNYFEFSKYSDGFRLRRFLESLLKEYKERNVPEYCDKEDYKDDDVADEFDEVAVDSDWDE